MVSVIHASRNPYDLASITSVLVDAEAMQKDMLFDTTLSVGNVVVKTSAEKIVNVPIDSCQSSVLNSEQHSLTSQSPPVQNTHEYQDNNSAYRRGTCRGHGYGNNRLQCQLYGKFVHFQGVTTQSPDAISANLTMVQWND